MICIKISEQFVRRLASLRMFLVACLAVALNFAIATLFAMMFVACSLGGSTEETSLLGGSSEEPDVVASLENISVRGLAMVSASPESVDSTEIGLSLSGMPKGSVVTLYELDPDSLERTGVSFADTIDNDYGTFDIQGVTLNSPYVWITAVEKEGLAMDVDYMYNPIENSLRVSAFVDVRDMTPVTVDIFSDLVAYRARVLMLIGNSYKDAVAQAKREILEAFGVYGVSIDSLDVTSIDYYAMQSVLVGVANSAYDVGEVRTNEYVVKAFEQTGSFMREKKTILYGIRSVASDMKFRLSIPQSLYDQMGTVAAKEYQAMLLYEKYLAGMLSVMLEAGQCTTEREGTTVDIASENIFKSSGPKYNIVCRSGSWHMAYEQVPHTFGTMTDTRDGITYKTVTIDFGGQTQTWMAENLRYNGVESSCLNDKEQNCNTYGRQYDWHIATGLGESILRNEFDSMQECIDSLSPRYSADPLPYDSAFIAKCIAELDDPNPENIEKCEYYGGKPQPIDYDSLKAAYNQEILDRCERSMSADARFIDYTKLNLDSMAVTQGVCPDGWRIPTLDDWETIFQYIDRKWHSTAEGSFLLAAPSIGDPFGFGLNNTVEMEWAGAQSLKVERLLGMYMMISTQNDRVAASVGEFKSVPVKSTGWVFNYDAVSYEVFFKKLFVRCIKN